MVTKKELENQIKAKQEAALVVNTHSRRGRALFFKAVDLLMERGFHLTSTHPVHDPVRLPETVRETIKRGNQFIIVGGGDGTISSIVDQFAYKDLVLGLLPLGTGNNFAARTMQIPRTLEGAVEVIVNGKLVDVDLGEVNGDYFANTASLGFSAEVARQTPRYLKRWLGVTAYGLMGLRLLFSQRRFQCTIEFPDHTLTLRTHQVVIANGNYFGVIKLTDDGHVDSRRLAVFTMQSCTTWQTALLWLKFFLGKAWQTKETRYLVTREAIIKTDPPQYLNVDGEVTSQTPSHFKVAAGALKVMAPQSFQEMYE